MTTTLADLTKATFEPLLHQRFAVRLDAERTDELELVELTSLGAARPKLREPFSLIFCGPAKDWFQQGMYPLEHPALGSQPVFLVPIGPNEQGQMRYQAVFS